MERSLASDTFGPDRHLGASVMAISERWTTKFGIFSTSFQDKSLTPSSAVGVPPSISKNAGWAATGGAQYFDVSGRFTYAPIREADRLLHLGASGRYHQPNDSTGANDNRVLSLGSNTFAESNVLQSNLVGTPDLSCGAVSVGGNSPVAGKCVKNTIGYGAELALAYGCGFRRSRPGVTG